MTQSHPDFRLLGLTTQPAPSQSLDSQLSDRPASPSDNTSSKPASFNRSGKIDKPSSFLKTLESPEGSVSEEGLSGRGSIGGEAPVDLGNYYDPSTTSKTQVYQISSTTSLLMQDIQNLPTVTSLQIQQADPGLENDRKSIYGHPLYPLLSLLMEKCESATAQPDSPPPDTFEADMRAFVQRQEADGKPFFSENSELDSLMVKAIQVLRIHLVELRKVNELCKDFCSRYISCLKTKIQTDAIPQDSAPSSPTGSEPMSPPYGGSCYQGYGSLMSPVHGHQMGVHPMLGHMGMGCYMNGVDGSATSPPPHGYQGGDPNNSGHLQGGHHRSSNPLLDPSKQKRGVLPKRATQVMKQWLFQHLVHPYPTEDEKRQIAGQTNLTLLQVNNWFINARRRILHPMLDSSNPLSSASGTLGGDDSAPTGPSKKKKAATNRPTNNRFWPASLAHATNVSGSSPTLANNANNNNTTSTSGANDRRDCLKEETSTAATVPSSFDGAKTGTDDDVTDDAHESKDVPFLTRMKTPPAKSSSPDDPGNTTSASNSCSASSSPNSRGISHTPSSFSKHLGVSMSGDSAPAVITTFAESTTHGGSHFPSSTPLDPLLMLGFPGPLAPTSQAAQHEAAMASYPPYAHVFPSPYNPASVTAATGYYPTSQPHHHHPHHPAGPGGSGLYGAGHPAGHMHPFGGTGGSPYHPHHYSSMVGHHPAHHNLITSSHNQHIHQ